MSTDDELTDSIDDEEGGETFDEDETDDFNDAVLTDDADGSVTFSDLELYGEAVDKVLAASPTNVVIIAGNPESGKTTLIATLMERFYEGEFANYFFSGSQTLGGFERRCFDARLSLEGSEATTPRTRLVDGEVYFLHLVVRPNDLSSKTSLLFADMSGEEFELMQLSVDEIRKRPFLKRADHFSVLFDGKVLTDRLSRQSEKTKGVTLLKSLLQEQAIGTTTAVQVIFSRWDFVNDHPDLPAITRFVEKLREEIIRTLGDNVAKISFHEVASRPSIESTMPSAFGVAELFHEWLRPVVEVLPQPQIVVPATLNDYFAIVSETQEATSNNNA